VRLYKAKMAEGLAQGVEQLPWKCEAWSSIPVLPNEKEYFRFFWPCCNYSTVPPLMV
jgi:hypothetical protein